MFRKTFALLVFLAFAVPAFAVSNAWKDPVRCATTANITLSGYQTVDGVSVLEGNSVLVMDQTATEENGIYVAHAFAWYRRNDFQTGALAYGATVFVSEGATNGNKTFQVTTNMPIAIGSTSITWAELGGGGTPPTFADVTTGTSAAALHVGTGGSLDATGAGTIAATSCTGNAATASAVAFSGVSTGTNAVALHVGTGGTLDTTGTGTITANRGGAAFTTADTLADVRIGATATTQKPLVLQTVASQTAHAFEIQNSAGTAMIWADKNGTMDYGGGVVRADGTTGQFTLYNNGRMGWWSGGATGVGSVDTDVHRSSPGVVKVSNGSTGWGEVDAGTVALGGANGQTWTYWTDSELITLSTGGSTTDSTGYLLHANSIIEGVTAYVTTTITTATDWKLGDATTPGRFTAANSTMTSGTTDIGLVHIDQVGAAGPRQTSAAKLRITTTGTPGAGAVRVVVSGRTLVPPNS